MNEQEAMNIARRVSSLVIPTDGSYSKDSLEAVAAEVASRVFAAMTSEDRPAPSAADEVERLREILDLHGASAVDTLKCYSRALDVAGRVFDQNREKAATIASLRQQLAEATQQLRGVSARWRASANRLGVCDADSSNLLKECATQLDELVDSLIPAAPAEAGKQQDDAAKVVRSCGKHGCEKPATQDVFGSLHYYSCDEHFAEIQSLCEKEWS